MTEEKFDFHKKNLINETKEYVNLRVELARLLFSEKVAEMSSRLVLIAIFGVFILMVLLFLSIISWLFLETVFNSHIIAAFVQLGIFAIIICALWFFRKPLIIRPVGNYIVKLLLNDDSENSNGKEKNV